MLLNIVYIFIYTIINIRQKVVRDKSKFQPDVFYDLLLDKIVNC